MSGLSFSKADIYPGMAGYYSTRSVTIPESYDQNALVDNEDVSENIAVHTPHETHRGIMWTVGIVFGVILLLSLKF